MVLNPQKQYQQTVLYISRLSTAPDASHPGLPRAFRLGLGRTDVLVVIEAIQYV